MGKEQHTPTPWQVGIDDEPADGVKGIEINTDDGKTNIGYVMAQEIDHYTPVDRANAAFIVRACNSHYELLAAAQCEEAAENYTIGETSGAYYYTLREHGWSEESSFTPKEWARDLRRIAIAKAEGRL